MNEMNEEQHKYQFGKQNSARVNEFSKEVIKSKNVSNGFFCFSNMKIAYFFYFFQMVGATTTYLTILIQFDSGAGTQFCQCLNVTTQ